MSEPAAAGNAPSAAVLFVCLGNICRSPLAEALFTHAAAERGVADRFEIDSCGTGAWHVGKRADPRSIAVARTHGVDVPSIARQFSRTHDADRFDLIVAMDRSNRDDLIALGTPAEKLRLMLEFHPNPSGPDVPDPYYGGDDGFERVYQMLRTACDGLLDHLGSGTG